MPARATSSVDFSLGIGAGHGGGLLVATAVGEAVVVAEGPLQ